MMKRISVEHFGRMNMMTRTFESNSKSNKLYLPEYEVSNEINKMIKLIEKPSQSDFKKIERLIKEIDKTEHHNGSQWYDYKIHLNAVLRENGFNSNII
ncbi:hypothetical protein Q4Q39_05695 [Flavivirga amylovorans]|uniref:DUF507 family protein n=1 Tax=Flavivirga amylovorans TaxID=870486 RepID=A0ABT8WYX9_9FLAO|nr:hypothetical protein [Flavivirga amylovorans]MDO5986896.1 hypothetical protein [Flavivirga amylovorans]